ncbi:MAG TPA: hypothetical protein VK543_10330, partial [Puia sp.]|nr:hypothetical protein [Puia sp.]
PLSVTDKTKVYQDPAIFSKMGRASTKLGTGFGKTWYERHFLLGLSSLVPLWYLGMSSESEVAMRYQ